MVVLAAPTGRFEHRRSPALLLRGRELRYFASHTGRIGRPSGKCWISGGSAMVRLSFVSQVTTAAVIGLLYVSMVPACKANAADIKVLATVALDTVFNEAVPDFERVSGNKLMVDYGVSAQVKNRIL